MTSYWCLAHEGETPIMQVGFAADFSHDDPEQVVVVIDAYPRGTRARYPLHHKVAIRPNELISPQRLDFMVVPVVGEEGKNWKGRFVLDEESFDGVVIAGDHLFVMEYKGGFLKVSQPFWPILAPGSFSASLAPPELRGCATSVTKAKRTYKI